MKRIAETELIFSLVRDRLRVNGDWNTNDWRDAVDVLLRAHDQIVGDLSDAIREVQRCHLPGCNCATSRLHAALDAVTPR